MRVTTVRAATVHMSSGTGLQHSRQSHLLRLRGGAGDPTVTQRPCTGAVPP